MTSHSINPPYAEVNGQIVHYRLRQEGPIPVPLCNFTAKIVSEELRDDGIERTRIFKVEGRLQNGKYLPQINVPAKMFHGMNWTTEWGCRAIVYAGSSNRDHLRTAIQSLSENVPSSTFYTHTGWREIDGKWLYLHAGGAIGLNASSSTIHFCPEEGNLCSYSLPSPPTGTALVSAVKASMRLLELAPKRITFPLFSSIYRSILGEIVNIDFGIFLVGRSGVCKSELSAMVQAHFGCGFDRLNLPATWVSTENYLERQLFLAKDAIMVIDDFAPQVSSGAAIALHQKAERVLRAQGNRAGRGRMKADSSLRRAFYPRGLTLSSGEDIPRGQSLRARLVVLELEPGHVNLELLTELQTYARSGDFSTALASYIQYVSEHFEDLRRRLPARHRELRTLLTEKEMHKRTPEALASLLLGFEVFLDFAEQSGVMENKERYALFDEAITSLLDTGKNQKDFQLGEDPVDRFVELLRSSISSGAAYISDCKTGSVPEEQYAHRLGWREKGDVIRHEDSRTVSEWEPRGIKIGWLDDLDILLDPEASFSIVQRQAREQGECLPITKNVLIKRLVERNIVIPSSTERNKNVSKRSVEGGRRGVLVIDKDLLLSNTRDGRDIEDDFPFPSEENIPQVSDVSRFTMNAGEN